MGNVLSFLNPAQSNLESKLSRCEEQLKIVNAQLERFQVDGNLPEGLAEEIRLLRQTNKDFVAAMIELERWNNFTPYEKVKEILQAQYKKFQKLSKPQKALVIILIIAVNCALGWIGYKVVCWALPYIIAFVEAMIRMFQGMKPLIESVINSPWFQSAWEFFTGDACADFIRQSGLVEQVMGNTVVTGTLTAAIFEFIRQQARPTQL